MASIPFGAIFSGSTIFPTINFTTPLDWRARLTVGTGTNLLTGSVLTPLKQGNGIIFPYTPTTFIQHDAAYGAAGLTHTNYDHPTFESHSVSTVNVTCQFTANTNAEADYLRAVLHFLRSVTKMYFGQDTAPIAGTPPPVLRLNLSGDYVFKNVPVVVQSFNMDFPTSVDYISTTDNKTMIPSSSSIAIVMKPTYSRQATSQRFGLKNFASGGLLGSDSEGGFI